MKKKNGRHALPSCTRRAKMFLLFVKQIHDMAALIADAILAIYLR